MGGCGRRGGWARAGDTAGGRAGLGGRAAARLLGRDGCWGSALCKAGRTRAHGSEAHSFCTPWPQPSFSAPLVSLQLVTSLHPPGLPTNSRIRTVSRAVYRTGLTTTILPCALHPTFLPSFQLLPIFTLALQVSEEAFPESPRCVCVCVCPSTSVLNWELGRWRAAHVSSFHLTQCLAQQKKRVRIFHGEALTMQSL